MQRTQDQRLRSAKPTTIHGYAQFGDLLGFQRLLRQNPSLLNERNPVMAQTPLHVSSGYNRAEIVKFLLDWQGPDKVELEAKNMYGETPLHMAAKNGCSDAARLLLAHGAFVEANANEIQSHSTIQSLVLLDKLGAGTNPFEVAALGMSLLESFAESGALLTIAPTHHGELKTLKYRWHLY